MSRTLPALRPGLGTAMTAFNTVSAADGGLDLAMLIGTGARTPPPAADRSEPGQHAGPDTGGPLADRGEQP